MAGVSFYNDWEPEAAAWLERLIAGGHLPDGHVDARDIRDVVPEDTTPTSHFFAGIGGWPLALELARWPSELAVWTAS